MTENIEDHEVIPVDLIPSSFSVGVVLPDGVNFTPYGVAGLPDPSDKEAKHLTDTQVDKLWKHGIQGMIGLRDMADATFKWAVGDLANYTTKRFDNGRLNKLCDEYEISMSVARDCARLARQYEFHQRTQAPWSVHRVAAPLEVDARTKLLADSISERFTVEEVQTEADRIAGKKGAKRLGAKEKKAAADAPINLTESLFARMHERIQMSEKADNTLDAIIDALPAHQLEVKESGEGVSYRSEVEQLREALKGESKHLLNIASRLAIAVKLPKGAKRRVVVAGDDTTVDNTANDNE